MTVAPGVAVETIRAGDGESFPKKGDRVTVDYTGRLAQTGRVFDSSHDTGVPLEFTLGVGEVIRGWDEGIMLLSKGQQARLLIHHQYGYGAAGDALVLTSAVACAERVVAGSPPAIMPHADLIFDVELVGINMPRKRVLVGWDDVQDHDY